MVIDDMDFSKFPPSVGELKSDKTENSADWTPRDAMITMLRMIDQGADIDALVVCWSQRHPDKTRTTHFRCASEDAIESAGLLSFALTRVTQ